MNWKDRVIDVLYIVLFVVFILSIAMELWK